MERHTQPDVVPTRENAGIGHTARMTPRNTMNELLAKHNAGFLWPQDGRLNPLRDTMFSQVPPICIVTAGVKYYQFPGNPRHTVSNPNVWKRLFPQELTTGKQIAIWDLRPLRDEADGAFNAHAGRHQAIINNLLGSRPGVYYLDQIYGQIKGCLKQGLSLCLVLACTSNRRRSVGPHPSCWSISTPSEMAIGTT